MESNGGASAPDAPGMQQGVQQSAQQAAQTAVDQGGQVAGTAAEQTREVASTAAQGASQVVSTVAEQIGEVGSEVAVQARNLVDQSKTQFHEQAQSQTEKIADSLRRIGDELTALAEGRVEEASMVVDYARQAATTVQRYAGEVEQRGFDGVVQDVQRFARRRPGTFLLGALAAGFGIGRLLRNAGGENGSQQSVGAGGQSFPQAQPQSFAATAPAPQPLTAPIDPLPPAYTPPTPTVTDGTVAGMATSAPLEADPDAPVPPSVASARATGALPGSDT